MTDIQIEPASEIIMPNIQKGRPSLYPFLALKEKGQSFFVPNDVKSRSAVYLSVLRQNKRNPKIKLVLTDGDKDGRQGFRVQRIN